MMSEIDPTINVSSGAGELQDGIAAQGGANGLASLSVVVIIPCYNEELTVANTVKGFRQALPRAGIVVCDNNSTDRTSACAREAGATVIFEPRQGKGNAVRRIFTDIDADVYVLVDGDATYDPTAATRMIANMYEQNLDFLNGARETEAVAAYRAGHQLGNFILSNLVKAIFGRQFSDMLSGYKLFSRRYVKSFPALSAGFEIETELTVHALELRMACSEMPTRYFERPTGSVSKLKTYRDGARILRLIINLVRQERPIMFFGLFALMTTLLALFLGAPLIVTYLKTGLVPRMPTAALVVGLGIVSVLSFFAGLILDTITTSRQEMKRLAYLAIAPLRGQHVSEPQSPIELGASATPGESQ